MLDLGEIERKLLMANNAISTDDNGCEILRGLDPAESNFVIAVECASRENIRADEAEAYRKLRQKHLSSRQMNNLKFEDRKHISLAQACGLKLEKTIETVICCSL